jgi:hypothetical protein
METGGAPLQLIQLYVWLCPLTHHNATIVHWRSSSIAPQLDQAQIRASRLHVVRIQSHVYYGLIHQWGQRWPIRAACLIHAMALASGKNGPRAYAMRQQVSHTIPFSHKMLKPLWYDATTTPYMLQAER